MPKSGSKKNFDSLRGPYHHHLQNTHIGNILWQTGPVPQPIYQKSKVSKASREQLTQKKTLQLTNCHILQMIIKISKRKMQILLPYESHRLRRRRRVTELEFGALGECLGIGRCGAPV